MPDFLVPQTIYIGTYKRRARALTEALAEMFPKMEVTVTGKKRNHFNLALDGETIWDGKSMGPPRRHKFAILTGRKLFDVVSAAAAKAATKKEE